MPSAFDVHNVLFSKKQNKSSNSLSNIDCQWRVLTVESVTISHYQTSTDPTPKKKKKSFWQRQFGSCTQTSSHLTSTDFCADWPQLVQPGRFFLTGNQGLNSDRNLRRASPALVADHESGRWMQPGWGSTFCSVLNILMLLWTISTFEMCFMNSFVKFDFLCDEHRFFVLNSW